MTPTDIALRDLSTEDLPGMAVLHAHAFPASVLTEFGPECLRRYYDWQINGPHEVEAFGAFDGDTMLGMVVGGRFRGSTIGFVKRNALFLTGRVLRHPRIALRGRGRSALRTGTKLLVRRSAPAPASEAPEQVPRRSFGVLAIAVSPAARRRGVGRLLLDEAERRARHLELDRMHLSVDPENEGAVAFYLDLGWQRLDPATDPPGTWRLWREVAP